jgi:hypothetical protein
MGMSFASPWALLLIAAVALPLLAHLFRRPPKERRPFGSMLLIQRLIKKSRRRRAFVDRLLLLLRLLAMLALLGAIAGLTFYRDNVVPDHGGTGRAVVILDASASMSTVVKNKTALAHAKDRAESRIRGLPQGTKIRILSFGSQAIDHLGDWTTSPTEAVSAVHSVMPTGGLSNLSDAVGLARAALRGEVGEVYLYTDEAGETMVPDAIEELLLLTQAGSALVPEVVELSTKNVGVTAARYLSGFEGGEVVFTVTNFGEVARELSCDVILPDGAQMRVFAQVLPNSSTEKRVTVPREAEGGVAQARCLDDAYTLDDIFYFHIPRVGATRVLIVDGDPGDTPSQSEVYFVKRALNPWQGSRATILPEVVVSLSGGVLDPKKTRAVVLANVADPRPSKAELMAFVREGGDLLISVGGNVDAARYNSALDGISPVTFRKRRALSAGGEQGVSLALPDTRVPLFEPFTGATRLGFADVHVNMVMTVEPYDETENLRTLLRFEGGLPALVRKRVGRGSVTVWLSTFDLAWGDFAVRPVFPPLLQRLVSDRQSTSTSTALVGIVGDPVVVPLGDFLGTPVVTAATGGEVVRERVGANLVFRPQFAGDYQIGVPPIAHVAVNTPSGESTLGRKHSIVAAEASVAPKMFKQEFPLRNGLLGIGSLLLLLVTGLAMRGQEEQ